jgi:hypothetical protein
VENPVEIGQNSPKVVQIDQGQEITIDEIPDRSTATAPNAEIIEKAAEQIDPIYSNYTPRLTSNELENEPNETNTNLENSKMTRSNESENKLLKLVKINEFVAPSEKGIKTTKPSFICPSDKNTSTIKAHTKYLPITSERHLSQNSTVTNFIATNKNATTYYGVRHRKSDTSANQIQDQILLPYRFDLYKKRSSMAADTNKLNLKGIHAEDGSKSEDKAPKLVRTIDFCSDAKEFVVSNYGSGPVDSDYQARLAPKGRVHKDPKLLSSEMPKTDTSTSFIYQDSENSGIKDNSRKIEAKPPVRKKSLFISQRDAMNSITFPSSPSKNKLKNT